MKVSPSNLMILAGLAYIVHGGFWSDIIDGLKQAHRFDDLFKALGNFTDDLLSNDDDAAVFICEILQGDVPDAIAELPSLVESEVADEVAALTSFVECLPSIIPQVFSDIVQGGEVVVSIIEEIVTAPGAALTVIENGVVSVWSDITAGVASVVSDVTYFIGCDIFGDCPTFTDNGILGRCSTIMDNYSATMVPASATPTAAAPPSVWSTPAASWATPGTAASTELASQTAAVTADSATNTPSPSGSGDGSSSPPGSTGRSTFTTSDGRLGLFAIGLALIVLL